MFTGSQVHSRPWMELIYNSLLKILEKILLLWEITDYFYHVLSLRKSDGSRNWAGADQSLFFSIYVALCRKNYFCSLFPLIHNIVFVLITISIVNVQMSSMLYFHHSILLQLRYAIFLPCCQITLIFSIFQI